MKPQVVKLEQVSRSFVEGGQSKTVLSDINLSVGAGEWVALKGASGSGKTTLLSIVGGLDSSFDGHAEVFGTSLRGLSDDALTRLRIEQIGFVFQSFHLLEHLSVEENVRLPLWLGADVPEARVVEVLSQVGLHGREQASVKALSGGERQRVAIARALVSSPRLVLADEPTGNLDDRTSAEILDLIEQIKVGSDDRGVLIATHDPRVAKRADRVIELEDGRLRDETSQIEGSFG